MKNKITMTLGEPGTGKSTEIISESLSLAEKGESLVIIVPTHKAGSRITTELRERKANDLKNEYLYDKVIRSVKVFGGYNGEDHLFFDEAGQMQLDVLYAQLFKAQAFGGTNVHLYGDIKQLPAIKSQSIIEQVLRYNFPGDDFWTWVNTEAYKHLNQQKLKVPYTWQQNAEYIDLKILRDNYRLKDNTTYTAYDEDFYSNIIEKSIEDDTYLLQLKEAIDKDYLIIVPTKNRGEQVNAKFKALYNNKFKEKAPFITFEKNGERFINPFNPKSDELHKLLPTFRTIDLNDFTNFYDFTSWVTVHSIEGITVDSVCFYLGNDKIPTGEFEHHYSNNMLYVSVSRARFNYMLLGPKDNFLKMRNIVPKEPQQNLKYYRARQITLKTLNQLETMDKIVDTDKLYQLYLDNEKTLELSQADNNLLKVNAIKSEIYDKKQFMRYLKEPGDKLLAKGYGFVYAQYAQESKTNNTNAKGRGKIQTWINSLNEEELEEVKQDTVDLSVRKFRAKYNKTKSTVRKLV